MPFFLLGCSTSNITSVEKWHPTESELQTYQQHVAMSTNDPLGVAFDEYNAFDAKYADGSSKRVICSSVNVMRRWFVVYAEKQGQSWGRMNIGCPSAPIGQSLSK